MTPRGSAGRINSFREYRISALARIIFVVFAFRLSPQYITNTFFCHNNTRRAETQLPETSFVLKFLFKDVFVSCSAGVETLVPLLGDGELDAVALGQGNVRLGALADHEDIGQPEMAETRRRKLMSKNLISCNFK